MPARASPSIQKTAATRAPVAPSERSTPISRRRSRTDVVSVLNRPRMPTSATIAATAYRSRYSTWNWVWLRLMFCAFVVTTGASPSPVSLSSSRLAVSSTDFCERSWVEIMKPLARPAGRSLNSSSWPIGASATPTVPRPPLRSWTIPITWKVSALAPSEMGVVLVNEQLASKAGLDVGDGLPLSLGAKAETFQVIGIVHDLNGGLGTVGVALAPIGQLDEFKDRPAGLASGFMISTQDRSQKSVDETANRLDDKLTGEGLAPVVTTNAQN